MAASWTVLDSDAERQAAALRRSAGTVGPWPLYASSVLDEQYDKVAGRAALTLTRVDGRMAAWRRSGATGPGLMTSYSFRRADDATAAPLGGTQPTGAFIPGSSQAQYRWFAPRRAGASGETLDDEGRVQIPCPPSRGRSLEQGFSPMRAG